jgi:AbrB family looped-hinge helix DNA binding protein
MTLVTLSHRLQVTIPKALREHLHLKPGDRFAVIPLKRCIHLIPLEPIASMRGFLKGIDTTIPDEQDRV